MNQNQYELILVGDGSLSMEDNSKLVTKFTGIVEKAGGKVIAKSDWGRRKLPYEINKKGFGIFNLMFLQGNGTMVDDLQRQAGYDDSVLKCFTLLVKDAKKSAADFEALKKDPKKNAKLITEGIGG